MVSAVNITEIVAKQIDESLAPDLAERRCDGLSLDVMLFGHELAWLAGKLRADTKHKCLSAWLPCMPSAGNTD